MSVHAAIHNSFVVTCALTQSEVVRKLLAKIALHAMLAAW